MKCVHCGNELMPGSKFCTNCGTPVSEPVTPVPSPNTGSSQDPMGNWPASDFTAPPENSSPDSVAEEISAAVGSDPSASQSAPVYQESISQDSFSASGSAAQEAPSECGDIPSAVPPAGHQAQTDGMPSAPYGQAGGPLIPKITPGTFLPLILKAITAAPRLFTQISPTTLSPDILRVLRRLKNPASLF